MKIIVIGGGISGLASAALLSKDGHKVTIIEKNKDLGGRARMYEEKGYKFDIGPSWYLMPSIFERFFAEFGKKPSDYYKLEQLDTHYKVFFPSGNEYTIYKDLNKNIELFEKTEKGAGKKLQEYLDTCKELNDLALTDLVYKDYDTKAPFLDPVIYKNVHRMRLFYSFHKNVERYFKNEELQKILEFTTVFLGGSPYNTPAFYSILSYTDMVDGIWHPHGGIQEFIQAIIKLNKEYGTEFITEAPVLKINVENGIAKSIKTKKGTYEADLIINSSDYQFAETKLLEPQWQSYPQKYWDKKVLAPSCFNIYLGVNKKLKNLEHHNFYFNASWQEHFENVFEEPKWPNDPSYYVHVPTVTDKSLAPEGKDVLFFLVPVAPGLNDTEKTREKFANQVITHFENVSGQKFIDDIEVKIIYSHKDFIKDYNAYKGTAFGLAHTLMQTSLLRPKNRSKKVKNLFHAGQYTNPGVGMPMALVSAQIVSGLVNKYNK